MRCINIDWLELFCSEGDGCPRDASYFKSKGYEVKIRAYGTPQYREMFTISEGSRDVIEVRRNPYSLKRQGGIFEDNDCHLRLSNRSCYQPMTIDWMRRFLIAHGYHYKAISRIDICLDLLTFDNGMLPNTLLQGYLKNKFSKLNQCNIAAHGLEQLGSVDIHGRDSWNYGRLWNSIKWGSSTSSISTKLYNKAMEMRQTKEKYYIEDAWRACGLWPAGVVKSEENKDLFPDVWRVEFSIKSAIKGYAQKDSGEYIPSTLSLYDAPDKLWARFCCFAAKYFNFRIVEMVNGKPKRKDRCKPLNLFNFDKCECFVPIRLSAQIEPTRTDRILINYLKKMIVSGVPEAALINAIRTLLDYLFQYKRLHEKEFSELLEFLAKQRAEDECGAVAPQLDFQLR